MKKSRALLFLTGLLLWSACERYEDLAPFKEYKIKRGRHSSLHNSLRLLNSEQLTYDVIFDETAVYETNDPNNQADINKLFGFADCNSLHHENSARFGWRWDNVSEQLEILAYVYAEGVLTFQSIGFVELNRAYRYHLLLYDDHYSFEVEGVSTTRLEMNRGATVCNKGLYYRLWPYFGGDEKAPHDISIFMRRIYEGSAL